MDLADAPPGTHVRLSRLTLDEERVGRVNAHVVAVVDGTIHLRAGAEDLRVRHVGNLYYPDRAWGDRYGMTELRAEVCS